MQRFIIVRRQVILEQKLMKQLIESMLKSPLPSSISTLQSKVFKVFKTFIDIMNFFLSE
jgi:hypothetical protein